MEVLYFEIIDYRNEIQVLLQKNPLFVYESMFVESVDLFYKICRGAQRGPNQKIDFIYPGRNENKYKICTITAGNSKCDILFQFRHKMVWTR